MLCLIGKDCINVFTFEVSKGQYIQTEGVDVGIDVTAIAQKITGHEYQLTVLY